MRLGDATLSDPVRLLALDLPSKLRLARSVAARCGPSFEARDEIVGAAGLPSLRHRPSGLVFAVIPGGRMRMGFTLEDERALREFAAGEAWLDPLVDELSRTSRPARTVEVAPFVVSVRPLRSEDITKLSRVSHGCDTFLRADAIHFVESTGCRLPSEAELEWLSREASETAFTADGARRHAEEGAYPDRGAWGIERLTRGEWAADDWHDDYTGAPEDSSPWLRGDPSGSYRGAQPFGAEDRREVALGLACIRGRLDSFAEYERRTRFSVRLALDVPAR